MVHLVETATLKHLRGVPAQESEWAVDADGSGVGTTPEPAGKGGTADAMPTAVQLFGAWGATAQYPPGLERATKEDLPVADDVPLYAMRGTAAGLRLLPLTADDDTAIANPTDIGLGQIVRWRGYDLPGEPVEPGTAVPITVCWQVEAPIDRDWKTFIHLVDETGAGFAQVDQVPLGQYYPPSAWQPGRLLVDQYELPLPPDLPPGRYQLLFGWYSGPDRLVWEDGRDTQLLGHIDVAP